jgi:hypothetical protein
MLRAVLALDPYGIAWWTEVSRAGFSGCMLGDMEHKEHSLF